jgi:transcription antitermination factor NusA-like protein
LEFPVCTFDLRTGVLCSKCEAKLRGGELTQTDLTVMKALLEHERHDPRISSLSYVRSFRLNNKLFVVLREGGPSRLPQEVLEKMREAVSRATGLDTQLIEEFRDLNRFIQSLIAPARVVTVNRVWLPDQTEEIRVVVDDERSVKTPTNLLSELVRNVKGLSVSFEFMRRKVYSRAER